MHSTKLGQTAQISLKGGYIEDDKGYIGDYIAIMEKKMETTI